MAGRGRSAAIFAVVAVVAIALLTAFALAGPRGNGGSISTAVGCALPRGTVATRSNLQSIQFGAVKEYALLGSSRWSNAITEDSDGSVWFGEQSVPGVGHLFLNGTLVEYSWPSAAAAPAKSCGYRTGIWGVEWWNGMAWATDQDENAVVGVSPASGRATVLNVSRAASEPYTLALDPDGSLWFTALSKAVVGRLAQNLTVTTYPVKLASGEVPLQIDFVNSSYAYMVALNPLKPYGHLYSFDPANPGAEIDPVQLGGQFQLLDPSSVSASGNTVWVTQHGASNVAEYDTRSGNWTIFPTSTVNFTTTTLPYFVDARGEQVWFNEHYANRIAMLNTTSMTLTEYSEASPPVENGSLIQNDLSIAPGDGGLWFTSVTGNYIGFVNGSSGAPFSLTINGEDSLSIARGATANFSVAVRGAWQKTLQVQVSDSEDYDSVPHLIQVVPGAQQIPAGSGQTQFRVTISPAATLAPGRYTVGVSVSNGLVSQTAYFFLSVS